MRIVDKSNGRYLYIKISEIIEATKGLISGLKRMKDVFLAQKNKADIAKDKLKAQGLSTVNQLGNQLSGIGNSFGDTDAMGTFVGNAKSIAVTSLSSTQNELKTFAIKYGLGPIQGLVGPVIGLFKSSEIFQKVMTVYTTVKPLIQTAARSSGVMFSPGNLAEIGMILQGEIQKLLVSLLAMVKELLINLVLNFELEIQLSSKETAPIISEEQNKIEEESAKLDPTGSDKPEIFSTDEPDTVFVPDTKYYYNLILSEDPYYEIAAFINSGGIKYRTSKEGEWTSFEQCKTGNYKHYFVLDKEVIVGSEEPEQTDAKGAKLIDFSDLSNIVVQNFENGVEQCNIDLVRIVKNENEKNYLVFYNNKGIYYSNTLGLNKSKNTLIEKYNGEVVDRNDGSYVLKVFVNDYEFKDFTVYYDKSAFTLTENISNYTVKPNMDFFKDGKSKEIIFKNSKILSKGEFLVTPIPEYTIFCNDNDEQYHIKTEINEIDDMYVLSFYITDNDGNRFGIDDVLCEELEFYSAGGIFSADLSELSTNKINLIVKINIGDDIEEIKREIEIKTSYKKVKFEWKSALSEEELDKKYTGASEE